MTLVDVFPDAEALVSAVIRNAIPGSRVYSSVPKDPAYPLIVVKRLGGLPAHRARLDAAELQLDVWGNTKSEARLLAMRARQAVWAAEGTSYATPTYPADAFITGVQDSLGLTWLPDFGNSTKDRYTLGLRVYLHKS